MDPCICYQCAAITRESCAFSTEGAQNGSYRKPATVPTSPVWPALPVGSLIPSDLWSPQSAQTGLGWCHDPQIGSWCSKKHYKSLCKPAQFPVM